MEADDDLTGITGELKDGASTVITSIVADDAVSY